jgi:hypothetical protein
MVTDKECTEKKTETKEALRKPKEKNADEGRTEYWERRKAYERTIQNKRSAWQETAAEYNYELVGQKELKKNVGSHMEYYKKKRTFSFCGISTMDQLF